MISQLAAGLRRLPNASYVQEREMNRHDEKRSSQRFSPPSSLAATADFPTKARESINIENMGQNGFCFSTETDISGESLFSVSMNFSDEPPLNIDTQAVIVWQIHDEASSLHIAGARFSALSEEESEAVLRFLESLQPEEGGEQ
jgi:hypothetical protein